jgi:hypothetical protein
MLQNFKDLVKYFIYIKLKTTYLFNLKKKPIKQAFFKSDWSKKWKNH